MSEYRVTWEIDIVADTPEEAAKQAREWQTRPGTTALVFDVFDDTGDKVMVDLLELAEDAPAKDAPAKDAPAKDAPAKDAPAEDAAQVLREVITEFWGSATMPRELFDRAIRAIGAPLEEPTP